MGRDNTRASTISIEQVRDYLRRTSYPDAQIEALRPLGADEKDALKSYGYGRPLRATFTSGGTTHDLVFRTMSPDPFGHNRRSARAENLILAFDTFNDIPRHIRAHDVGAFDDTGMMLSMGEGEVFLVTNYVDGQLYASDLSRVRHEKTASASDVNRARALARYLAELHSVKKDPSVYARAIRDTIGGGEGIFGLCDSYPDDLAIIPLERLNALEISLIRWRWRLRAQPHRAARTHGDFHPFNVLFRTDEDFSVLDCSRGGVGEPADDVTCMSINYLFFALTAHGNFEGALRDLWNVFWETYLEASGDRDVMAWVAPFFTWRTLVLASPTWYPDVADSVRDRLFEFAERLLAGEPFEWQTVDELLR